MTNEKAIMALSNKQIQSAYRARHLKAIEGTGARLDVLIDDSSKTALKRMATHYRVTQRAMLQTLIDEHHKLLTHDMDDAQHKAFFAQPDGPTGADKPAGKPPRERSLKAGIVIPAVGKAG